MTPYPTDLDVLKIVRGMLAFVRGQGSAQVAAKDAWEAAGFALGRTLGEPPVLVGAAPMSDEEALEGAIAQLEAEQAGTVTYAVNPMIWAIVARIAARILANVLGA